MRTEDFGTARDQLGLGEGRGVERDLVGAVRQQLLHVLDAADAAADRERDEDLVGRAGDHVQEDRTLLGGGRDVEEHELVRALMVVMGGQLGRVPGVAQPLEADAFHHPAGVDVEAGNDALGRHQRRSAIANATPLPSIRQAAR